MQAKAPTERDVEVLLCGFETTSNRSWPNLVPRFVLELKLRLKIVRYPGIEVGLGQMNQWMLKIILDSEGIVRLKFFSTN